MRDIAELPHKTSLKVSLSINRVLSFRFRRVYVGRVCQAATDISFFADEERGTGIVRKG